MTDYDLNDKDSIPVNGRDVFLRHFAETDSTERHVFVLQICDVLTAARESVHTYRGTRDGARRTAVLRTQPNHVERLFSHRQNIEGVKLTVQIDPTQRSRFHGAFNCLQVDIRTETNESAFTFTL